MPKKSETKISEIKEEPIKKTAEKSKKITQSEYEEKVIELAKKGLTSEQIGEELKKQKVYSKDYSKKISKILKEKNIYKVPELKNVEKKLEKVKKHYEKNPQDKRAMREKDRIFAQLRKLKKYFKV